MLPIGPACDDASATNERERMRRLLWAPIAVWVRKKSVSKARRCQWPNISHTAPTLAQRKVASTILILRLPNFEHVCGRLLRQRRPDDLQGANHIVESRANAQELRLPEPEPRPSCSAVSSR